MSTQIINSDVDFTDCLKVNLVSLEIHYPCPEEALYRLNIFR
jgi:hypothetical protein